MDSGDAATFAIATGTETATETEIAIGIVTETREICLRSVATLTATGRLRVGIAGSTRGIRGFRRLDG